MNRLFMAVSGSIGIGLLTTACAVNSLPPPARPDDPVRHYQLEVPDSIEVVSIGFDMATFAKRGEGDEGRAFINVIGRSRQSGRFLLLLFENVAQRRQPVEIIEIVPVP